MFQSTSVVKNNEEMKRGRDIGRTKWKDISGNNSSYKAPESLKIMKKGWKYDSEV